MWRVAVVVSAVCNLAILAGWMFGGWVDGAGADDGYLKGIALTEPACLRACGLHKGTDSYTEIQTDRQGFVICSKDRP